MGFRVRHISCDMSPNIFSWLELHLGHVLKVCATANDAFNP